MNDRGNASKLRTKYLIQPGRSQETMPNMKLRCANTNPLHSCSKRGEGEEQSALRFIMFIFINKKNLETPC